MSTVFDTVATPTRPRRVLWITTDHQRFDCIRANGNPHLQTPALDRLTAGGVSFDNLYVQSPICMPSRASFMTGLYPRQTGVVWNGMELPKEGILSCADLFNAGQWNTAQIGKLHFQNHDDHDLSLQARHPYGFRYFCPSEEPGCYEDAYTLWLRHVHPEYAQTMHVMRPSRMTPGGREMAAVDAPAEVSQAGFCADQTIACLKRTDQPGLIHMGIYAPHPPLNPPAAIFEKYRGQPVIDPICVEAEIMASPDPVRSSMRRHAADWPLERAREYRRYFYAMCEMLDSQIGRVIAHLEKTGELADTLILVHADHGDMAGDHYMMQKGHVTLYPEVMRVPCLVHWPRGLQGGRRFRGLAEAVDLLPTLGEFCGIPMPRYLPGRSLAAALRTAEGCAGEFRESVYAEIGPAGQPLHGMVRTREWSYARYAPGAEMLFDLQKDPQQLVNRVGEPGCRDALHAMRELMLTRSMAAGASRLPHDHPY